MTDKIDLRHPLDIERTLDEMRAIREAASLTQEELARLVGVPRAYISKWENRNTKYAVTPSYEHLVILHRTLCGLRLQMEATHGK